MGSPARCIFECDADDLALLHHAKSGELQMAGVINIHLKRQSRRLLPKKKWLVIADAEKEGLQRPHDLLSH